MGTAANYAVMGATAITNTGPTVINGNLAISPGDSSSVTGTSQGGQVAGDVHDSHASGEEPSGDRQPEAPRALDGHQAHRTQVVDPDSKSIELCWMGAHGDRREFASVLVDGGRGVALRVRVDPNDDHLLLLLDSLPRWPRTILPLSQSRRYEVTRPSACLLYTSDAADDLLCVDLGGRR